MSAFIGTAPISFLILFVVYLLAIRGGVNQYMVKKDGAILLILLGLIAMMGTLLVSLMTNNIPMLLSQDGHSFEQIVKMTAGYSWTHIILQTIGVVLIGLGITGINQYD